MSTAHTVCHRCAGDGAVVFPRATVDVDGEQARGYNVVTCPDCGGEEWLLGAVPPI
ncbi:MAG TPA: hypothetical protein VGH99_01380 [Pseudonocardia sp.]